MAEEEKDVNVTRESRTKHGRKLFEAADVLRVSYRKGGRWKRGETPSPLEIVEKMGGLPEERCRRGG